jgi:hypothetical protein
MLQYVVWQDIPHVLKECNCFYFQGHAKGTIILQHIRERLPKDTEQNPLRLESWVKYLL